jgi:hypothetical protein
LRSAQPGVFLGLRAFGELWTTVQRCRARLQCMGVLVSSSKSVQQQRRGTLVWQRAVRFSRLALPVCPACGSDAGLQQTKFRSDGGAPRGRGPLGQHCSIFRGSAAGSGTRQLLTVSYSNGGVRWRWPRRRRLGRYWRYCQIAKACRRRQVPQRAGSCP